MDRNKLKKSLLGVAKDVVIAFTIVCIVMIALYAYCGIWPPMVVVESGSMQRFDDKSVVGVIDTGDMVFVKKVNGVGDITTYVDGEGSYTRYGNYGDVVIYRPDGLRERTLRDNLTETVVPIIHRAVIWIAVNTSKCQDLSGGGFDYDNCTFDVPSLARYGTRDTIILSNYGYWKDPVAINLGSIMDNYEFKKVEPHSGFITKGDHNFEVDQIYGRYEPVLPEWIVGRAVGELPWFGLIKLKVTGSPLTGVPRNSWTGLYTSIFLLLFIPLLFDILYPKAMNWRERRKREKARAADAEEAEHPDDVAAEMKAPEPGAEGDANLGNAEENIGATHK